MAKKKNPPIDVDEVPERDDLESDSISSMSAKNSNNAKVTHPYSNFGMQMFNRGSTQQQQVSNMKNYLMAKQGSFKISNEGGTPISRGVERQSSFKTNFSQGPQRVKTQLYVSKTQIQVTGAFVDAKDMDVLQGETAQEVEAI